MDPGGSGSGGGSGSRCSCGGGGHNICYNASTGNNILLIEASKVGMKQQMDCINYTLFIFIDIHHRLFGWMGEKSRLLETKPP